MKIGPFHIQKSGNYDQSIFPVEFDVDDDKEFVSIAYKDGQHKEDIQGYHDRIQPVLQNIFKKKKHLNTVLYLK